MGSPTCPSGRDLDTAEARPFCSPPRLSGWPGCSGCHASESEVPRLGNPNPGLLAATSAWRRPTTVTHPPSTETLGRHRNLPAQLGASMTGIHICLLLLLAPYIENLLLGFHSVGLQNNPTERKYGHPTNHPMQFSARYLESVLLTPKNVSSIVFFFKIRYFQIIHIIFKI